MLATVALLALCYLTGPASAATWYFLRYYTPSGAKFTSLSGEMVIPTLPKAGTYYLWPGLQPTDNSGVYQNVLDGRSGTVSTAISLVGNFSRLPTNLRLPAGSLL